MLTSWKQCNTWTFDQSLARRATVINMGTQPLFLANCRSMLCKRPFSLWNTYALRITTYNRSEIWKLRYRLLALRRNFVFAIPDARSRGGRHRMAEAPGTYHEQLKLSAQSNIDRQQFSRQAFVLVQNGAKAILGKVVSNLRHGGNREERFVSRWPVWDFNSAD